MTLQHPPLISVAELSETLPQAGCKIFDASWHMPAAGRDARAEHAAAHIPGAAFFDIDALSDPANPLPHMLPDRASFQAGLRDLGLNEGDSVVVYDTSGIFGAARAWWMLRAFGLRDVRVLDGGLPAWIASGCTVTTGPAALTPGNVTLARDAQGVVDLATMQARIGAIQTVDARSADRFEGRVPEPRAGLASGHIPGSRNLPFGEVLRNGHMRAPDELGEAFAGAGLDPAEPFVAYCGSGVTGAILLLAAATLGHVGQLYDGSWTEWGGRPETAKATGPARTR